MCTCTVATACVEIRKQLPALVFFSPGGGLNLQLGHLADPANIFVNAL